MQNLTEYGMVVTVFENSWIGIVIEIWKEYCFPLANHHI